mmetsp:Transcript_35580/g.52016  ORF Transcript_35580/g.52016 Transcript_35580/m.52016 type:complete len:374 (+) Transcript_35580:54-1175(+)
MEAQVAEQVSADTPPPLPPSADDADISVMLNSSFLECGVCLSIICEPITISCGHTFCRGCLVTALKRSKKKCPTCRAVCHNSAEDQPENVMLANIAKSCFPTIYEDRLKELENERKKWSAMLPIFYYNMPMFPGETLSLHLFEPRYKLMMQRIVSTSRKFAYVPNYANYSAEIGNVALLAELKEVEFLSDGRCLLEAKITQRLRIMEHFVEDGTQGLHYCRTESLVDDSIPQDQTDEVKTLALQVMGEVNSSFYQREDIRAKITAAHGPAPDPEAHPEALSLWVAAVLPLPPHGKQALLETLSTRDRLFQVLRILHMQREGARASSGRCPAMQHREQEEEEEEAMRRQAEEEEEWEDAEVTDEEEVPTTTEGG